jgi:Peptidase C65 Otubain
MLLINMRDANVSNMIVAFLRLATSAEIGARSDFFCPFVMVRSMGSHQRQSSQLQRAPVRPGAVELCRIRSWNRYNRITLLRDPPQQLLQRCRARTVLICSDWRPQLTGQHRSALTVQISSNGWQMRCRCRAAASRNWAWSGLVRTNCAHSAQSGSHLMYCAATGMQGISVEELSVEQFRRKCVEPMGEESDEVHIVALTDVLQVRL